MTLWLREVRIMDRMHGVHRINCVVIKTKCGCWEQ